MVASVSSIVASAWVVIKGIDLQIASIDSSLIFIWCSPILSFFELFQEFDKKYNPTWHCIVGRNFGSYVTHETKHFIYFYLGQVAILLFKSG